MLHATCPVHGLGDYGFLPIALREGSEPLGVYRLDAARLYRFVLDQGATEPANHAIADEGVPFKEIAEVIGRRLGLPIKSRGREHFG